MGWDSASNWNTKADAVNDTTNSMIRSGWTILDKASTSEGAYWAVKLPDGKQFIYCAIVEKRDGQVFIKTMSEDMGPRLLDCPLRLLEHACTIEHKSYSDEWRQSVKSYHANKSRDLMGLTVKLYDNTYKVIGKQKRSYIVLRLSDQKTFRLTKSQESAVKVVDTQL